MTDLSDFQDAPARKYNTNSRFRTAGPSVSRVLLVSMIAFGVVVGMVFPLFAKVALDLDQALTFRFLVLCVCAGIAVGMANFALYKFFVSRELERVVQGMKNINDNVTRAICSEDKFQGDCQLEVNSADMIGEMAQSFNRMSLSISERISQEGVIRRYMAELSATVELKKSSRTILEAMAEACGAVAGIIFGKVNNDFQTLAFFGFDKNMVLPKAFDMEGGPLGEAVTKGRIVTLSPDEDGLEWVDMSTPFGRLRPKAMHFIPLIVESRTIGLIALGCGSHFINLERIRMIDSLRSYFAPYLQNSLLHKKIKQLATVDSLTNIMNRRYGIQRLKEEFSMSIRHGSAISVIILDIDFFKNVNDTCGHAAGDVVLKSVAEILEKNIRAGEVVCRYGGEEFLVVIPGGRQEDAVVLAERLRRAIEEIKIRWLTSNIRVTASFGVATWPVCKVSGGVELVDAADEALYLAKKKGRNLVAVHRGSDKKLVNVELPGKKMVA